MSKFKKNLVSDIKLENETAKRKEVLRQQHGIQDKNVIIIEKNNMVKFTIQQVSAIIKLISTVLILALAAIGLLSLTYPNIRNELMLVFTQYYEYLQLYFSM